MQSRYVLLSALACAFGFGSTVHADPLNLPLADPSSLRSRLLAASAAPAPTGSASTSAATKYTGKMIVKIDAVNRSAVPTNAKIICSVAVFFGSVDQSRIYTAPAVVTPSKVGCTVAAPYQVTTDFPQSTAVRVVAFITNLTVTSTNPIPNGFGFVEFDPPGIALPPDGAVTTQTISSVL